MKRHTVGVLFVLVASAGFGTLAIFGKLAEAAGLNTATLLAFRFAIGAALLWAGLAFLGRVRSLPTDQLRTAVALGVLYAGFSALFFWGLLYVPAGVAAIAFYTYPAYVYAISVAVLGEGLSRLKLLALLVAVAGVGLIVGADAAAVDPVGVALVLLAALGYAVYIAGSRLALGSIDPDLLAGVVLVVTAASFLAFGLASGRLFVPVGLDQWGIVVGIAVLGTALPIFLYVSGLQRIEASRASVLGTSEPLVTVLLGAALLGEVVTLRVGLGGALVLLGVALIQTDATVEVRTPQ
ncbi:MAG: EamA family transporter [Haloferacaceae archaeon]